MVSLRSDLAEVGLASCLFGVAAGVPPAVEPGILPGGLLCGRRRQFRVPRRHSGRQDAVLYGSQDGCRDSRKPALNSYQASRLFLFLVLFGVKLSAADSESALSKWLQSQTHIQTWSAEVIQTRALKSLTEPLTAVSGSVNDFKARVWMTSADQVWIWVWDWSHFDSADSESAADNLTPNRTRNRNRRDAWYEFSAGLRLSRQPSWLP